MNTPKPLTPECIEETIPELNIRINELKEKLEFIYKEYKLIIGLYKEYLVIFCNSKENEYYFQLYQNYREIIKIIPNFRIYTKISDIFKIIIEILYSEKYDLELDKDNNLKIILKLMNMVGKEEQYELTFKKFELEDKIKIDILKNKIKNCEIQIKEITKEKNEMKNKINDLTNENILIKKELNDLKMKINSLLSNSAFLNIKSEIIYKIDEIGFILKEIEKKNKKIKEINLIYNASEDGDKITDFHSKCDNKSNTLMIIQTTTQYIFGGFTKVGWKNVKGEDIYDDNAFCFSVNLKKIYNIKDPKFALHCQSYNGRPSFGSNSYVFLLENEFLSKNSNSTHKITDFYGEKKVSEINGGDKYFQVDKLEVFQISF